MLSPTGDTDAQLQDQVSPDLQGTEQGGLSGAVVESFAISPWPTCVSAL